MIRTIVGTTCCNNCGNTALIYYTDEHEPHFFYLKKCEHCGYHAFTPTNSKKIVFLEDYIKIESDEE